MFDVPEAKTGEVRFQFQAPLEERDWSIGLVVGPSGAGKSSVARHLFGDCLIESYDWARDAALIDGFPKAPIRELGKALSSVGFSSPPSWLKPYHVLSTGERFRANMARALVDSAPLIAVDEFTSVVDRTVAQIGSCAIGKAVRRNKEKRFVAVSCHDDIIDWLQPDWLIEPHLSRFSWRSVQQRPAISGEILRVRSSAWGLFRKHHYLTGALNKSAACFVCVIGGQPAAFTSLIHFPHPKVKNLWNLHRTVVLPDFQGIGLGGPGFVDVVASMVRACGRRVRGHTAHPALMRLRAKSPSWRMDGKPKLAAVSQTADASIGASHAYKRRVAHFEYVGAPYADPAVAKSLIQTRLSDAKRQRAQVAL